MPDNQETINIKLSDIDSEGNVSLNLKLNIEQPVVVVPEPPKEPEPTPAPYQVLFPQDWAEGQPESSPSSASIPLGLQAQFDIEYKGAMFPWARGEDGQWENSSSYATGGLAYHEANNSIFLAGSDRFDNVGEFKIPSVLSFEEDGKKVPPMQVLQKFTQVLTASDEDKANYLENSKINDLYVFNDKLIVTSEIWYDANGDNKDHLQALDANDLKNSDKETFQSLQGAAMFAGYMSPIPEDMVDDMGGEHLIGWSSVYSITSRLSQGFSIAVWSPQDAVDEVKPEIPIDIKQVYPLYKNGIPQSDTEQDAGDVSPIWSAYSKGLYGFIIPNTRIFMGVGEHGGIHSGIGYKVVRDDGVYIDGFTPLSAKDKYSYFWLYDLDAILAAENPWDVLPFSYGKWQMPYKGKIIGATFDGKETLYISLWGQGNRGAQGYERPPLIVSFNIKAKEQN